MIIYLTSTADNTIKHIIDAGTINTVQDDLMLYIDDHKLMQFDGISLKYYKEINIVFVMHYGVVVGEVLC